MPLKFTPYLEKQTEKTEISAWQICLCWGFTAQSTQWGHVERGQFYLTTHLLGRLGPLSG